MAARKEIVDTPPIGWFPLDVMNRDDKSKKDWVALMIDVHPDDLKHCWCDTAFLYVHPNEYQPKEGRRAQEAWVSIPGKHRSKRAAWEALQDLLATRH